MGLGWRVGFGAGWLGGITTKFMLYCPLIYYKLSVLVRGRLPGKQHQQTDQNYALLVANRRLHHVRNAAALLGAIKPVDLFNKMIKFTVMWAKVTQLFIMYMGGFGRRVGSSLQTAPRVWRKSSSFQLCEHTSSRPSPTSRPEWNDSTPTWLT